LLLDEVLCATPPTRTGALVEGCEEDSLLTGVLELWARKGIIAYTVSPMTASRTTVQIEPMTLPRVVRNLAAGPGRLNEDNLVARPGSSAASRRSISASIRCSSIESAIAPYLRVPRAGGNFI
jgi:hypothetical protein